MEIQRFYRHYLPLIVLVLAITVRGAYAEEPPLHLTLKDAIRMAVERNLEVRAELYNPAMGEADIRLNRGIYDPLLTLSADYQESTTQPASIFLSGARISRQKNLSANAGISQLVPTGGTIGLFFDNLWNRNNSDISRGFLDEYWQTDLAISYSQPLLKNFGKEATELGIAVAVNSKTASLDQFRSRLIDVVTRTRTAYFLLYSLRENLEAKKTALTLANKILDDTRGRVKAGVLPAMETLNAEFGVSTREKERIDAEKLLQDQMDAMRVLLQTGGTSELVPVDQPAREDYPVDEAAAIRRALAERPDLKAQKLNIQTLDLQTRVAHNRTLPDLTFSASAALTGLGRDYSRDLDNVSSGDYPVWGLGLHFTYPLGNREAQNDFIKSRLKTEQARIQLKNLEDNVRTEVSTAIRGIRANFLQLEVADRGLAYAEERMRAYIKKNEVGLATTKEVVDVQNDLVAAQANRIRAQAEYNIALAQFWKVTGETLEHEGITFSGKEADALYDANSR